MRQVRCGAFQEDLLRERTVSGDAGAGDVQVIVFATRKLQLLAFGGDGVRCGAGAGGGGQPGRADLPAVCARPMRAAGVDTVANAWSRHGD